MRADEGALALMEGKNVILEVELCGISFRTALLGALKHTPHAQVHKKFVLL